MKRQIDEIGKNMNKRTITDFRPTFRVLVDTFFIAILWPAVLCWVGYRLFHQLDTPVEVAAVGSALFAMGLIFFPLELLRQSCRTNGLVQSHFTWPAPVVTMIRRNLRWLKLFAPPFALVAALFHAAGSSALEAHESLGRLCFVAAILLAALFLHRVLRPSGATFRAMVANRQGGWLERLKYVFYAVGVLVPMSLAGLAVFGYYYTAEQLVSRFYATLLLALAVLILDALILRWLLVTRRRLAMEQLRQRRQAALAQAQAAQAAGGAGGSASPVIPNPVEADDERLDVAEMNDQTRQLIRSLLFVGIVVGLWGVWVDVLPALAVLKKVQIHALTIERIVEEPAKPVTEITATPAADTAAATASTSKEPTEKPAETTKKTIQVPITLADLLLGGDPFDRGHRGRPQPAGHVGNDRPPTSAHRQRGPLCDHHARPIRLDDHRRECRVLRRRSPLAKRAMVGGGVDGRPGLRASGNLRELLLRHDRASGTAGPRGRHCHRGQHHRHRHPDSHAGHHDHQLGTPGNDHPQQGFDHRHRAELDALGHHSARVHPRGRRVWFGHGESHRDALQSAQEPSRRAGRSAAFGDVRGFRRQHVEF